MHPSRFTTLFLRSLWRTIQLASKGKHLSRSQPQVLSRTHRQRMVYPSARSICNFTRPLPVVEANPQDCYWCVQSKHETSATCSATWLTTADPFSFRLCVDLGYLGWFARPPGSSRHQHSNCAWSYLESGPSWLTRFSPRH